MVAVATATFESCPERDLVALAREGHADALGELLTRVRPRCYNMALKMMRNPQDAEDLVQESCRKILIYFHTFSGEAQFSTWATRIVINECMMAIRNRRKSPLMPSEYRRPNGEWADVDGVDPETAERCLLEEERLSLLHTKMERIPTSFRSALQLYYVEDRSIEETATALEISIGCAKSRVHRAIKCLRERMVGRQAN